MKREICGLEADVAKVVCQVSERKGQIYSIQIQNPTQILGPERDRNSMAGSINPRWSLAGMTALVTGGTRGIG